MHSDEAGRADTSLSRVVIIVVSSIHTDPILAIISIEIWLAVAFSIHVEAVVLANRL